MEVEDVALGRRKRRGRGVAANSRRQNIVMPQVGEIFCSRGANNAVGAASSKNCKISEGLRELEEQLDSRQSFSSSPSPQLSCPLQRKMPGMHRLGWVHLN